ncbi:glutamine amidotransferase [Klebsiella michiganensis]|uniref:Glutamine amidotransferase n=1 Tax=Klebsiella michiganensis TaxID=1134687 RepID=A0A7H4N6Y7_9ENTR|nr:glutamine amidotransferase [Klebsiella michiganensis]
MRASRREVCILSGRPTAKRPFCWLLHSITERYPEMPGDMVEVFRFIATLAGALREKGRV